MVVSAVLLVVKGYVTATEFQYIILCMIAIVGRYIGSVTYLLIVSLTLALA